MTDTYASEPWVTMWPNSRSEAILHDEENVPQSPVQIPGAIERLLISLESSAAA